MTSRHHSAAVVVTFFIFLSTCLLPTDGRGCQRDGRNAVEGRYPAPGCRFQYLVSIKHPILGEHTCAGTLISQFHVLTSASCLASMPSNPIVGINGYYREDFEKTTRIRSVINHPNYGSGGADGPYDVAVARLEVNSGQDPVRLASRTPSARTRVAVVGWGRTAPQAGFSDAMQSRTDYRTSSSGCSSRNVRNGMICAGRANTNICEGDHGGPLIDLGGNARSDVQVGIVTRAVGDCRGDRRPGLFVNVASVRGFIDRALRA